MSLDIYSHDMKLLNALAIFRDNTEKAYKIYNNIDGTKAKLVAKYILDPPDEDEISDEYSLLAKNLIEQNPL